MSRFSPIKSNKPPEPPPEEIQTPESSEAQTYQAAPFVSHGGGQVLLKPNKARNGLELHFPDKPSDDVRAELKAAGWRWSFKNSCWYHRDIPANRDFAERFVAQFNGAEIPRPPVPPVNVISLPPNPASQPAWRMRLTVQKQ